jgi:hypothetical protein
MRFDKDLYVPKLRYAGAQIILSSDRVTIHSEGDCILIFGNKAVAISSKGYVDINSEGTTINAPQIELGLQAKDKGEPVTKATSLLISLGQILKRLQDVSQALNRLSETGLGEAIPAIVKATEVLTSTISSELVNMKADVPSKTTFTR